MTGGRCRIKSVRRSFALLAFLLAGHAAAIGVRTQGPLDPLPMVGQSWVQVPGQWRVEEVSGPTLPYAIRLSLPWLDPNVRFFRTDILTTTGQVLKVSLHDFTGELSIAVGPSSWAVVAPTPTPVPTPVETPVPTPVPTVTPVPTPTPVPALAVDLQKPLSKSADWTVDSTGARGGWGDWAEYANPSPDTTATLAVATVQPYDFSVGFGVNGKIVPLAGSVQTVTIGPAKTLRITVEIALSSGPFFTIQRIEVAPGTQ